MRPWIVAVLLIVALGMTGSARAQGGTWSFVLENDLFADTDRNYTNGIALSYTTAPDAVPDFAKRWAQALQRDHNPTAFATVSVGQQMFTPIDIGARRPLPDQHPYAGYLNIAGAFTAVSRQRLDSVNIAVGVVGPAALGEQAQAFVHKLIDGRDPNGWDNQLKNEPALLITYDRRYRSLIDFDAFGLQGDLVPGFGLSLGNVELSGRGSLALRFGTGLEDDYGAPRIRSGLATSGALAGNGTTAYRFAAVEGEAVGRSIFLDGNTFRDSLSVDRNPFVADFQFGAALGYNQVRVAYTFVVRTPTFDTELGRQRFGAVSVSLRF